MQLNKNFNIGSYIHLQNNEYLDKQRIAGKVVAKSHLMIMDIIKNYNNQSLININNIVEEFILDSKCDLTFKNYKHHSGGKNFPTGVCISVNDIVVHGIPTDYVLKNGDVVSFDLGATFEGSIADSAITLIVGDDRKYQKLLNECEAALYAGIKAIKVGNRIGCIGAAIDSVARKSGFQSIVDYCGHGISYKAHAEPSILNKSTINDGVRFQPGMVIAIEPQFVDGPNNQTYVMQDEWSVKASGISAHWEHSLYIHNDWVEVITDRSNL